MDKREEEERGREEEREDLIGENWEGRYLEERVRTIRSDGESALEEDMELWPFLLRRIYLYGMMVHTTVIRHAEQQPTNTGELRALGAWRRGGVN